MSALELTRWRFGVAIACHFMSVAVTIGITGFMALFQAHWRRRHEDRYMPDAARDSSTRNEALSKIRTARGGRADQFTVLACETAGHCRTSDAIGPIAVIPSGERAACAAAGLARPGERAPAWMVASP